MSDDDLIEFAEETNEPLHQAGRQPVWRILIVDDEPDVHQTTKLAVADAEILGRRHAGGARGHHDPPVQDCFRHRHLPC